MYLCGVISLIYVLFLCYIYVLYLYAVFIPYLCRNNVTNLCKLCRKVSKPDICAGHSTDTSADTPISGVFGVFRLDYVLVLSGVHINPVYLGSPGSFYDKTPLNRFPGFSGI